MKICFRFTPLIYTLVVVTSLSSCSTTYVIYGVKNIFGTHRNLIKIDPITTSVTPIGPTTNQDIIGLACSETKGKLYGTSKMTFGSAMYAIDTSTGKATYIGGVDGLYYNGLAYDSGHGVLYGISENNQLYTINTSNGHGTFIGHPGSDHAAGLAFYPFTNWLYFANTNTEVLYRVNPTTFAGSTEGLVGYVHALTYDPGTKTMYGTVGIYSNANEFVKIDLISGQANHISWVTHLDALASCQK